MWTSQGFMIHVLGKWKEGGKHDPVGHPILGSNHGGKKTTKTPMSHLAVHTHREKDAEFDTMYLWGRLGKEENLRKKKYRLPKPPVIPDFNGRSCHPRFMPLLHSENRKKKRGSSLPGFGNLPPPPCGKKRHRISRYVNSLL